MNPHLKKGITLPTSTKKTLRVLQKIKSQ